MTRTLSSPATGAATGLMRAAVVTAFGEPLEVQSLELPTPGPGEVLVKLETSGVCHTDLHAAHGDWPVKPQPPRSFPGMRDAAPSWRSATASRI